MTTYTDISPATTLYASATMLTHAVPKLVLHHTATMKTLPKNKTQVINFTRYNNLSAVTTPLSEGVTPAPSAITRTNYQGTIQQFGQIVPFTDVIEDTHTDPVITEFSVRVGENVARSQESLDWAVVRGSSAVIYANGSARTDVNTPISLAKVRSAVRTLNTQKAERFTSVVAPSPDFATKGIESAWIAIGHTDLENDIRNLPGFTPTTGYGQRKTISDMELGAVENIRFLLSPDLDPIADAGGATSTMVSTSNTSADIYPLVVFGRDAWARVALGGQGAIDAHIIPAGMRTKDDPLGQRGSVSAKFWHLAMITNPAWMVRIECAATEL